MSWQVIEKYRKTAEVYHGKEVCKKKSREMLEESCFPSGLLPLEDIIELGHDGSSGFFWVLQQQKVEHTFEKIDRKVIYDTAITAFVERGRMRKISGCKTREFFMWVSASEIYIDDSSPEKLTVKGPAGFRLSFPVSAFQLEQGSK
ncbi:hypothetical protein ACLOJK_008493 [Asimina triloba]